MNSVVSIIVPVFNAERWLKECLDSIIYQSYQYLDIILVDDGSTDESGKICDQYARKDARIKVIHTKNGGVSSARNLGLDSAQGEYVSFIDSDDFVDTHYISAMLDRSEETGADIVFCQMSTYADNYAVSIDENIPDDIQVDVHNDDFVKFFCRFFSYKSNIFGSSWRTLFKKNIIENIRFASEIKISEDLLFLARAMLNATHISSVEEHLYFYRKTSQSVTAKYKKFFLSSQLSLYAELKKIFGLLDTRYTKRIFEIYTCLLCYYALANEVKFRPVHRRENIDAIKKSVIYTYFNINNGLKLHGIKLKIKFMIIWFLVKMGIV